MTNLIQFELQVNYSQSVFLLTECHVFVAAFLNAQCKGLSHGLMGPYKWAVTDIPALPQGL